MTTESTDAVVKDPGDGAGEQPGVVARAGRKVAGGLSAAGRGVAGAAGGAGRTAKRTAGRVATRVGDTRQKLTERTTPTRVEAVDIGSLSSAEKLAYCRILIAVARAYGVYEPRKIANLYLFVSTIGLDAEARHVIRAEITGTRPADTTEPVAAELPVALAEELCTLLEEGRRKTVFVTLVRDLVRLSWRDHLVPGPEREVIVQIAALVFADAADKLVQLNERVARTEERFVAGKVTTSQLELVSKDVAAKAAAFGAPITAVSVAGSVTGLSGAGITSGLAALGFGGLLGLSAMVTGIGTAVILGVVAHQGTRYLLATNERGRDKKREHLIQQVLSNHQRAMAELTDDIAGLAERMEEYLHRTNRNEKQLAALAAELSAFQLALVDLKSSRDAFERQESVVVG